MTRIKELLEFIYGKDGEEKILPPLVELLEQFKRERGPAEGAPRTQAVTHKDALLICYGDMLSAPAETGKGETALARLERFLAELERGSFTCLHLLPFHPYSSDDGFSVIDYRKVDPRLGDWDDIEKLGRRFKMTFDFVINHGSVKSDWFRRFLAGEAKYRNWYLTRSEHYDWSKVVRPRTHPLLTPFEKSDGSKTWVWTTFSADQADYDFSCPELLLEFIGIFLDYIRRGGRMLRLDAIAYLWKEDGSPCLHHPKTHAVVKLLRAIVDYLGLPALILTETNVPHTENISYFGDGGNEAHLVYNFALPPLVLHAAVSGDAGPLRKWAAAVPALPGGNCFLNFLASHDGVGLTPARGLVEDAAFAQTIEEAQKRGALVSMKSTAAGPVPYELNCSWADTVAPESLGPPETQARAFLATYAAALAMPGLPAVYFHSWVGSRGWKEGPALLGYNRAINREKPAVDRLERELAAGGSFRSLVLRGFEKLLAFRSAESAFDPASPCRVLESEGGIFALLRGPDSAGASVLCAGNFSPAEGKIDSGVPVLGEIVLPGRGVRWIAFDDKGIHRELSL
ncbi:MAG: sugar phosphorylase [Treponema sp.]|jgi:sucrose phosphorylase|nr:sugar phosphorylase [Treponema sp.]